jgi:hypothetical protein
MSTVARCVGASVALPIVAMLVVALPIVAGVIGVIVVGAAVAIMTFYIPGGCPTAPSAFVHDPARACAPHVVCAGAGLACAERSLVQNIDP